MPTHHRPQNLPEHHALSSTNLEGTGVPPAHQRNLWITRKAAQYHFPGASFDCIQQVRRPGGNRRSHLGFWRSDCREAQLFGVLDRAGIDESLRARVRIPWIELGLSKKYLGSIRIWPFTQRELAIWGHQYVSFWHAAVTMARNFPVFAASKLSLLRIVTDAFEKTKNRPHSILPAILRREPLGLARDDEISESDIHRRGVAFVGAFLEVRDFILSVLPLALDLAMQFLTRTDVGHLSQSFPIEWNISSKYEQCIMLDVLERADISVLQLQSVEPHRQSSVHAALYHVLAFRGGWVPHELCGGIDFHAALSNFMSLVIDESSTRSDNFHLALSSRLKIMGLAFCLGPFTDVTLPIPITMMIHEYVYGISHICLDELIALVSINVYLLTRGPLLWSLNIENYHRILHITARAVRNWQTAVDFIIQNPPPFILPPAPYF